jgi:cytochrome c oxidase assembly protein subunit 15
VSQLHTDAVFLLLGLTVAIVLVLRSAEAPRRLRDAALLLLVVELAQGAVGFAQYFTGLPVVLVGLHLLGAALTAAAITWLVLGTRDRLPVEEPAPAALSG